MIEDVTQKETIILHQLKFSPFWSCLINLRYQVERMYMKGGISENPKFPDIWHSYAKGGLSLPYWINFRRHSEGSKKIAIYFPKRGGGLTAVCSFSANSSILAGTGLPEVQFHGNTGKFHYHSAIVELDSCQSATCSQLQQFCRK